MKVLVQALCSQSETSLGTLRVPSGTLGARPQVARELWPHVCVTNLPSIFIPIFGGGYWR